MANLHRIESWFLTVISHPIDVEAGINLAQHEFNGMADKQIITWSASWPAADRLEVYWNAYFARLQECMRDQFALLAEFLGEEVFSEFVNGYLRTYPSTCYTLGNLGNEFPRFLRETRPPRTDSKPDFADLIVEFAEFELMVSQVFDGPGTEQITEPPLTSIAQVQPTQHQQLFFDFAPCLRALEFRFPVAKLSEQIRQQAKPYSIEPSQSWMALTRENYVVRHYPLECTEYRLLTNLLNGQSLGTAISNCCKLSPAIATAVNQHVGSWFQRWTQRNWIVGWRLTAP